MKKFLLILFVILFFILSFFMIEKKNNEKVKDVVGTETKEKRAVFLSYLELEKYLKNKQQEESKQNIINILNNLKSSKFNMIILHVRAFSDAIYPSNVYPLSDTVKVNQKSPEYDILKYIIDEAKKRGIEVHAWINPYRISSSTNLSSLQNNTKIAELISNNDAKLVEGKGIFYNPASSVTNELIINGIKEIITNYDIDGIHFDDYFYPDYDIDLKNYQDYINSGGDLSHEDYKYSVILNMIKNVYSTIKSVNSNIKFGISPEGNIENNYNKHYLDVKKILSSEGYVDYIMPQIYFGFLNEVKPFIETLNEWDNLIKVDSIKLIPALAFYKTGRVDKYAKSGENEWINNSDIIKRQIEEIRKIKKYDGFSLFRYDYLFDNEKCSSTSLDEYNNLISILD